MLLIEIWTVGAMTAIEIHRTDQINAINKMNELINCWQQPFVSVESNCPATGNNGTSHISHEAFEEMGGRNIHYQSTDSQ